METDGRERLASYHAYFIWFAAILLLIMLNATKLKRLCSLESCIQWHRINVVTSFKFWSCWALSIYIFSEVMIQTVLFFFFPVTFMADLHRNIQLVLWTTNLNVFKSTMGQTAVVISIILWGILLGENLAINFLVFTLFIYKKTKKNGSLLNDYIHCDLFAKNVYYKWQNSLSSTELYVVPIFVRELSIPKIPPCDFSERSVPNIILGRSGGETT